MLAFVHFALLHYVRQLRTGLLDIMSALWETQFLHIAACHSSHGPLRNTAVGLRCCHYVNPRIFGELHPVHTLPAFPYEYKADTVESRYKGTIHLSKRTLIETALDGEVRFRCPKCHPFIEVSTYRVSLYRDSTASESSGVFLSVASDYAGGLNSALSPPIPLMSVFLPLTRNTIMFVCGR